MIIHSIVITVTAPDMKAMTSVRVVMVIETPACLREVPTASCNGMSGRES